jgi:hypothetical protein
MSQREPQQFNRPRRIPGPQFWVFLALVALALAPGRAGATPALGVWAQHTLTVGAGTQIQGLDVGVRAVVDTGSVQINLGPDVDLSVANVYGHRVSFGTGTVIGHLYADSVTNNGGNFGTLSPFPTVARLPSGPAQPGSVAVNVPANSEMNLPPGSYGNVTVQQNASLRLSGGVYDAASLSVAYGAQVIVDGASLLRVGPLFVDTSAVIGPDPALGLALNLRIQAWLSNTSPTTVTPAVSIAAGASVSAFVLASNGVIQVGNNAVITGVLDAAFLSIGDHVSILSGPAGWRSAAATS